MFCFLSPLTGIKTAYAYSVGDTVEVGHWPYQYCSDLDIVIALNDKSNGTYEYNGGYYYVSPGGLVYDTYPITWKVLTAGSNMHLIQEYVYIAFEFDEDLDEGAELSYNNSGIRSFLNDGYTWRSSSSVSSSMIRNCKIASCSAVRGPFLYPSKGSADVIVMLDFSADFKM